MSIDRGMDKEDMESVCVCVCMSVCLQILNTYVQKASIFL